MVKMNRLILMMAAVLGCGTEDTFDPYAPCDIGNHPTCEQGCVGKVIDGPSANPGEPAGGRCDAVGSDGSVMACENLFDIGGGHVGCCDGDFRWFDCGEQRF